MSLAYKVNALPETVTTGELAAYFREVLTQLNLDSIESKQLFVEIVFELADKQWHNYEQMDAGLKQDVDKATMSILLGQLSLDLVSAISGIIGRLGLCESYQKYKVLASDQSLPTDIRREINNTISEFGESVDNSY